MEREKNCVTSVLKVAYEIRLVVPGLGFFGSKCYFRDAHGKQTILPGRGIIPYSKKILALCSNKWLTEVRIALFPLQRPRKHDKAWSATAARYLPGSGSFQNRVQCEAEDKN